MHCGDQRHLGLCLGYVPALAYGSCRVSDQGTTLRASDLHNARATILNPFNSDTNSQESGDYESDRDAGPLTTSGGLVPNDVVGDLRDTNLINFDTLRLTPHWMMV